MNCTICNKPLSGGIDTFGDIRAPMCWTCHCEGWPLEVFEAHMDLLARETELEHNLAELQSDREGAIADGNASEAFEFAIQIRRVEKELETLERKIANFEADHPGIAAT